jgi:L-ascorbate metabolism protein UlaG (beta-lactamase superfamily)
MNKTRNGIRLGDHVKIDVAYQDRSPLGGALSQELQDRMRLLFQPIYRAAERYGPEYVVRHGPDLLRKCFSAPMFAKLCGATYPELSPAALFPDVSSIRPASVRFTSVETGASLELAVSPKRWRALNAFIGQISGATGTTEASLVAGDWREIAAALAGENLLTEVRPTKPHWGDVDATFLGHNTVVVRSSTTTVLIDPWFFPGTSRYPPDYQPIQPHELGSVDAVLITHSHPDHFDPASLMRLGPNTPLFVPRVPRESIVSVDMKKRSLELGFQSVKTIEAWKTVVVGDIQITALPFHGEQPTTGKRLYPEVRNWGNCYLIRTPRFSCAVIADSGRDLEGNVKDVALESFERFGPIDILFAGYRGWSLYPVQYFDSSVRQYLLFVPPELFQVRQSIMNTVDDAVDTAEAWHARYLVPYADGGAPWHEEIGLGPVQNQRDGEDAETWAYFDPPPQQCLTALSRRSAPIPGVIVGSPVQPLLLRPGQSIRMRQGTPQIKERDGHRWPTKR